MASILQRLLKSALVHATSRGRRAISEQAYASMLVRAADAPVHAPNTVFIDAGSADAYNRAHVPGARLFTFDTMTKARGSAHVWSPEEMQHVAAQLGIHADSRVVVYDSGIGMVAARVWWTLRYFGHEQCVMLDGGFPAYVRAGRPVSVDPQTPLSASTGPSFTATPIRAMLADKRDVLAWVQASDSNPVLDVRTAGEFSGAEKRNTARGGHIPRAAHIPYNALLNADRTFRSPEELRGMFSAAGVRLDAPVITHCLAGMRAAVGVIALHLAGAAQVRNYDAGMIEWLNDRDTPVVMDGDATRS